MKLKSVPSPAHIIKKKNTKSVRITHKILPFKIYHPIYICSLFYKAYPPKKGKHGHSVSAIPPTFILYTLCTRVMYVLVKCEVAAALVKASINGSGYFIKNWLKIRVVRVLKKKKVKWP